MFCWFCFESFEMRRGRSIRLTRLSNYYLRADSRLSDLNLLRTNYTVRRVDSSDTILENAAACRF